MTDALIIGGHGKVALLAAPMLGDLGFSVTSVIRDPEQSADIEGTGATPLVLDITRVTPDEWDTLLARFDVIVWSAGAGGGSPERTYAVDRDAALAVIDSLERLRDAGQTPRFINVSYLGATHHRVPGNDSFYPYADAKKTVDDRLNSTVGLEYLILGPSALTMEPAVGYATPTADLPREDSHTSRELVAEVITVFADRSSLPADRTVEFVDGFLPAGEI
ncbi:NAD(P)H-binding protein [Corynebacterium neomassiliense]|uniref:NAD(P)H-binding protein n=1 Tax=Corynebacterium neomassiliense TaxID=2079482 RepID=UPI001031B16A|nr:NAD(P)H-binding protein [Corynebacterium neomassiliense]